MIDPFIAFLVAAGWVWVMGIGLLNIKPLDSYHTERDIAKRTRTKLKWVFWPIYLPLFLLCGLFWLIYIGLRGAIRGLENAKLFKKLDKLDNVRHL